MLNAADVVVAAMAMALLDARVDLHDPEAVLALYRAENFGAGAILAFGEAARRLAKEDRAAPAGFVSLFAASLDAIDDVSRRRSRFGLPAILPKPILDRARAAVAAARRDARSEAQA